jgi:putative endonuclease
MSDKIKTGTKGENLTADYFVSKGYEVVARNFRYRRGEIDLIVKKDNWMIFVEVKTRSSYDYGAPEQFVSAQQCNRIIEAAEEFIYKHDWHGHVRVDVVSVKVDDHCEHALELTHFEDAIH